MRLIANTKGWTSQFGMRRDYVGCKGRLGSGKCLFLREEGISARGTRLSVQSGVTFHTSFRILSANSSQGGIAPRTSERPDPMVDTDRAPISLLSMVLLVVENLSGADEASV